MAIKILMPALSPTMTDGKLSRWIKKEGDKIKSGDIIAEIETDKATMEYEATEDGILGKILIPDATEGVKVNELIGVMLEENENASVIEDFIKSFKSSDSKSTVTSTTKADEKSLLGSTLNVDIKPSAVTVSSTTKIFITPLAKRLAEKNNIDIKKITGSGPMVNATSARIVKNDVEVFMSKSSGAGVTDNLSAGMPIATSSAYEDRANSGMRKTIAKRLLESKNTVPHYYLSVDCEMDALLDARIKLNEAAKDSYKLSINDFIIKALALAMQNVPDVNASWQGDTTRYFINSDIAIAVATPTGLITPIIRSAEKKGLVQISNEMKELAKKARDGKLQPSEYQGGGFSLSTLGMYGIKDFCAIINPPQAGILAVGATTAKPIVRDNNIVIANIMSVTLSADHRVVDGAVAAKFLGSFKGYMENPLSMLVY